LHRGLEARRALERAAGGEVMQCGDEQGDHPSRDDHDAASNI
jgi:hypothetical protein